jgi:hypothetical protein
VGEIERCSLPDAHGAIAIPTQALARWTDALEAQILVVEDVVRRRNLI